MHPVNLTNCDREPIHIPGKIQNFGFLITVDEQSLIVHCSENITDFLPVTIKSVLGKPVEVLSNFIWGDHQPNFFTRQLKLVRNKQEGRPANPLTVVLNSEQYNLLICPSEQFIMLEFEPDTQHLQIDLQTGIARALSSILANSKLAQQLKKATEEVRAITGFDRVMIYQFHEDGHGEVVAEDRDSSLPPFMGLHYPASDIPRQARELYKINLMRYIADTYAETSKIFSLEEYRNTPLDLTNSTLRAVSPIHIQYLKNMNVGSSFSVSLIHEGELWGLIACHNTAPLFVNYKTRQAANLIGKVLSSTLGYQQQGENQQKRFSLQSAVDTLAKQLSQSERIEEALLQGDTTLLNAVDATGAVLALDGKIGTCGVVPPVDYIRKLIAWLDQKMLNQLYVTQHLPLEFPDGIYVKDRASGMLAIRLSKEPGDYLIWFRPEVISTVDWAGDPNKPVEYTYDNSPSLSPRKSFEKWSQTVLNTSAKWEEEDVKSALHLKEELAFAMIQKAAETRKMNEQLSEAYRSLDAFSYTISHDLKNPLTTISAYSQMLNTRYEIPENARSVVNGIIRSTKKMSSMINHVLSYSQIGQAEIHLKQIDMENLLSEIHEELLIGNEKAPQAEFNIGNTPPVWAENTMAIQVFSNLITNAVKYSSKSEKPKITINGTETADYVEYAISDNGIGIQPGEMEDIFKLFKRSKSVTNYEGTGVGLSIVKRIMEKHNGKIWVESDGKTGSTFFVWFPLPGDVG